MAGRFDPTRYPRRLNLGCGYDRREGYLNVDLHAFHAPDLVADVVELPMLPDGYYEEILATDVLEHLPRTATGDVLREWRRLLMPGGLLKLRVPSLEGLWALFQELQSFERHEELMQCLFGTQAYDGDYHLTSFTRVTLEGHLTGAGFSIVQLNVKDGWLFEVVAEAVVAEPEGSGSDESPEPAAAPATADAAGGVGETQSLADLLAHDGEELVRLAYRVLLGRDPDPDGYRYYASALRAGTMDGLEVIARIRYSPEGRARAVPVSGLLSATTQRALRRLPVVRRLL